MIKTQCVVVRGNLNALRYSNEILTPICIPHLQNNGRMRLMHDGAPSHPARATRALLQANRINVLPRQSLSPDSNPIEHIWDQIGQRVRSRVPLTIRDLERFVVEEWNGFAQLTLRNYIASMRSRCQAVVNANRGHTRLKIVTISPSATDKLFNLSFQYNAVKQRGIL